MKLRLFHPSVAVERHSEMQDPHMAALTPQHPLDHCFNSKGEDVSLLVDLTYKVKADAVKALLCC